MKINICFNRESQQHTLEHKIVHIMGNFFPHSSEEIEKCEKEVLSIIGNIKDSFLKV